MTRTVRAGTRDEVVRRCLDALRTGLPELAVDNPDDPAVALVGAWASVVDMLDFYRDRIAEEGYVATAVEDRSALELGRAVGAGPTPPVGASVLLSFTAEQVPEVVVAAGTAVHSIPGQGETTQVFETETGLRVLPERNSVPLRQRRAQRPSGPTKVLRVLETTPRVGDQVLVRVGGTAHPRVLTAVHTGQPEPGVTTVEWADAVDIPAGAGVEAHVFRVRTAFFGHNAPDWRAMPADVRAGYGADAGDWPGLDVVAPDRPIVGQTTLELAGDHPSVGVGSWLLLRVPDKTDVLRKVLDVRTSAAANFAVAGPTTLVAIEGGSLPAGFDRRSTTVLAGSEPLTLADEPDTDEVTGPALDLAEPVEFAPGAPVIVVGSDTDGTLLAQAATVATTVATPTGSALVLTAPLPVGIVLASGVVLGNVVAATAGETVAEVLGDGDGSAAHQRFPVRQAAIGHVPAATGRRSTLDVRVDDVSWAQVPEMLSAGPADRVFGVREEDDGTAVVCFGDGVHGARLTTGTGNVVAVYRTAAGRASNVGAGTLRLLPISPLGVTGVDNPLPATGGADRRPVDLARIPAAAGLLDRVVSPADHLAFALAFPGVHTAALTVFSRGTRPVVHLDVVPEGGAVVDDLRDALREVRAPEGDLDVQGCREVEFDVALDVVPATPGDTRATAEVSAAVLAAFGAGSRGIAEPVALSRIVAVAQQVPGVVAVRPTALHRRGDPASLAQVLDAEPAVLDPYRVVPAQLLVVHEAVVREATR
ncbi:hypothetical protein [Actinophytocola oryzae]|uniref:Putative phage baseplate assembly protein n=1 Tax=Actinophytocola oryzae TaxID=502181 RepID=A0A4R7VI44_9PSEU|nr:hypothetical protein [Actinophytocola oryzae]TDV48769.1 putative phage baseplate assembly protein [Actinophytocola oryzae]